MRLDRFPQSRRVAIDLISRHPAHRHTLLPGMHKHRNGLLGLGFKAHLLRDPRLRPSLPIPDTLFRQIQPSI